VSRAQKLEPAGGSSAGKRVAAIVGVIVLVAAAFVGGLALANKSSSKSKASGSSSTTTSGGSSTSGPGSTGSTTGGSGGSPGSIRGIAYTGGQVTAQHPNAPYAYVGPDAKSSTGTVPPQTLPVSISISSTKNLHDGQALAIHVTPTKGSQMFGFEARECAPNVVFRVEFDFYPDQTGNCVLLPLSSDSDAHAQVKANPPYSSADLRYRVGEGTSTYTDANGKNVSITCGKGHPCQLVLLLQVPYGFGFATYPLSFG
jgi:hypothetical protein